MEYIDYLDSYYYHPTEHSTKDFPYETYYKEQDILYNIGHYSLYVTVFPMIQYYFELMDKKKFLVNMNQTYETILQTSGYSSNQLVHVLLKNFEKNITQTNQYIDTLTSQLTTPFFLSHLQSYLTFFCKWLTNMFQQYSNDSETLTIIFNTVPEYYFIYMFKTMLFFKHQFQTFDFTQCFHLCGIAMIHPMPVSYTHLTLPTPPYV